MSKPLIEREADGTWRARVRFMSDTCDRIDTVAAKLRYSSPTTLVLDAVNEFLQRHETPAQPE